jgi:succinate dehydrogenase / fumarate reductase cytochrome b subunit
VKHKRPVNLNLFTIRFPIPAIASILHRISGVILFLFIPFVLWGLHLSLASQQDFDDVHQFLTSLWVKLVIWGVLSALIYHLIAGIRHLLMDMGIGETIKSGKLGAQITIGISVIFIILAGIWLW